MKKPANRPRWYKQEGHKGSDVCIDLTSTIGIAITGIDGNLLWFVEEDQGAPGITILAHGTAESLQQAKRLSLAEATWFVNQRNKFPPSNNEEAH